MIINMIQQLEYTFERANQYFYDGKLETPVITVSPDAGNNCYGWFTTWKAWTVKGEGRYEINVSAEYLNRPMEQVMATLLHEMVHLHCLLNDIKDTSRGGSYHNKKFKTEAEKRGLTIEHNDKYGWTKTSLSDTGNAFIESLKLLDLDICRNGGSKAEPTEKKKKSSSIKHECPECGAIARTTKEMRLVCGDCEVAMEVK